MERQPLVSKELGKVSDAAIDQINDLRAKGFTPAFVIVGELEYNLIIEDMREHPMLPGTGKEGVEFIGLRIVPDFRSASRVDVTHEVGLFSDRLRKRLMPK